MSTTLSVVASLALAASMSEKHVVPAAQQALENQCRTQGADPKNPWALAHGITAFGPTFKASDGRLARDVMVHDFVQTDAKAGHYTFPLYEKGEPVSPHPNLLVKTLVDAGLPLSTKFKLEKGTVTLGELVQSVETDFKLPTGEGWPPYAWTFDMLAQVNKPGGHFAAGDGAKVDWNASEEAALAHLEAEQAFLGEAMDQGKPSVPKQRQHIWAEPCGGFHMVQAVMTWMRYPEVRKQYAARVDRQVAILFYRLDAETRVYDEAIAQSPPQYQVLLLSQKLKFYGHWLETVGRMVKEGVLKPNASQLGQIGAARNMLARTVTQLEQAKAFERTGEFKLSQKQLALDLIGDSCHAVNGLKLTKALSP